MRIGFYLYLVFIVSYFLHLTSRIEFLGLIRFDLILVGLIFIIILFSKKSEKDNSYLETSKYLQYLIIFILITLPLVEWPGSVIRFGANDFIKVIVFYYFSVLLINSGKKFKIFLIVFLACQTFRILEPAYLHITTGYWGDGAFSNTGGELTFLDRLAGAPSDIVNSNQLAWIVNSTIPFIYYLCWKNGGKLKYIPLLLFPIFTYVILLTGSRSGLLSLIVLVSAILYYGGKRFKRIAFGAILLVPTIIISITVMSEDLKTRYLSIYDSSVTGGDTAQGRIDGLKNDFSVVLNRPIFGHGLGTSAEANFNIFGGRAQKAHDLYIEVLQELGLIGFVLFALYIKAIFRNLLIAKRFLNDLKEKNSFLLNLIYATIVWMIMDLFYSLSCFGLNSWEFYLFGGISAVCLKLAKEYSRDINKEDLLLVNEITYMSKSKSFL